MTGDKFIELKKPILDGNGNHVFKFQTCPNEDAIVLHTRIRLEKKKVRPFLEAISKIHGITLDKLELDLTLDYGLSNPYELLFTKGTLFKWDEILPQIEGIIHVALNYNEQKALVPKSKALKPVVLKKKIRK
jgi:hypothetical protein